MFLQLMTEKSDDEDSDFYLPEDDPAVTLGGDKDTSRGPRIKIMHKGNEPSDNNI